MTTLVFIDDEKTPLEYYQRALRHSGFDVLACLSPDDAFSCLDRLAAPPAVLVLDVMMPGGRRYPDLETTAYGLKTGVLLYRDLRPRYPQAPIIVLTNVSEQSETWKEFPSDPNLKVVQKLEFPPYEFTELVQALVEADPAELHSGGAT